MYLYTVNESSSHYHLKRIVHHLFQHSSPLLWALELRLCLPHNQAENSTPVRSLQRGSHMYMIGARVSEPHLSHCTCPGASPTCRTLRGPVPRIYNTVRSCPRVYMYILLISEQIERRVVRAVVRSGRAARACACSTLTDTAFESCYRLGSAF